ncbi:MAG: BamA/TamA family outer membrane protein [Cyclobacteriaceae bacterium]|nr:BamA/TamA family outer membrane protein [Cyclobacteriaceae bacterium]
MFFQVPGAGNGSVEEYVVEVQQDTIKSERWVEIDNIVVHGNKRTRRDIITREMQLKQGSIIFLPDLKEQVEIDRKQIYNTSLFNKVETSILELGQEKVDIVIEVNERWYTFPSPILELADLHFNDWWVNRNHDLSRINYGMRLYQRNVRGRNETLRVTAQLGYTKKLGLNYVMPYLDKAQHHGLELKSYYTQNSRTPVFTENHKRIEVKQDFPIINSSGGGFTYRYRNAVDKYHYLDVGVKKTVIDDTIRQVNPQYFSNAKNHQNFFSIAYGFRKDKRDVSAYPLKGYMFDVSLRKVGLGIFDDVNYASGFMRFAGYLDLGKKFYVANLTALYGNSTKKISYNNYYGLGFGGNFVRGYDLYVIEGPQFFLNKTTFKKLLFSTVAEFNSIPVDQFKHFPLAIYLKTYFDFGYVKNYDNYLLNTLFTDKLIYGTGVGIDIITAYDIVMRLEYPLNQVSKEEPKRLSFYLKKEF